MGDPGSGAPGIRDLGSRGQGIWDPGSGSRGGSGILGSETRIWGARSGIAGPGGIRMTGRVGRGWRRSPGRERVRARRAGRAGPGRAIRGTRHSGTSPGRTARPAALTHLLLGPGRRAPSRHGPRGRQQQQQQQVEAPRHAPLPAAAHRAASPAPAPASAPSRSERERAPRPARPRPLSPRPRPELLFLHSQPALSYSPAHLVPSGHAPFLPPWPRPGPAPPRALLSPFRALPGHAPFLGLRPGHAPGPALLRPRLGSAPLWAPLGHAPCLLCPAPSLLATPPPPSFAPPLASPPAGPQRLDCVGWGWGWGSGVPRERREEGRRREGRRDGKESVCVQRNRRKEGRKGKGQRPEG